MHMTLSKIAVITLSRSIVLVLEEGEERLQCHPPSPALIVSQLVSQQLHYPICKRSKEHTS